MSHLWHQRKQQNTQDLTALNISFAFWPDTVEPDNLIFLSAFQKKQEVIHYKECRKTRVREVKVSQIQEFEGN